MTKREQQAEEKELAKAVSVLKAALRGLAQRKAHRYELEFLHRVRNLIDEEIEIAEAVNETGAGLLGREVANQVK